MSYNSFEGRLSTLDSILRRLGIDAPTAWKTADKNAAKVAETMKIDRPDPATVAEAYASASEPFSDAVAAPLILAMVATSTPAFHAMVNHAADLRREHIYRAALPEILDAVMADLSAKTSEARAKLDAFVDVHGPIIPSTSGAAGAMAAGGSAAMAWADGLRALEDLDLVAQALRVVAELAPVKFPDVAMALTTDAEVAASLPLGSKPWTAYTTGRLGLPTTVDEFIQHQDEVQALHRAAERAAMEEHERFRATGMKFGADGTPVVVL